MQPQHHAFPSRRRISLPTWRRESAAKIGFQALALGASCTRIDELTRAFSAFARNGSLEEPVYLRRVRDRAGQVVEDNTAASDPMGPPDVRLDRMVALAGRSTKTVIPPRAAWLTSQLLRRVVTKGHAPALRSTGLLVAGKTGTSSATMDTWFVGYTSRSMITTWIGDDRRERPLGYKDAAFMLNVPMAARFLWETTAGQPLRDIPWERPAGVRANDTGGNLRTTMEAGKPKTRQRRGSGRGSGAKARPASGRLPRARSSKPHPARPPPELADGGDWLN